LHVVAFVLRPPPGLFDARVGGICRPSIRPYRSVVAKRFLALDSARVTRPANRLQIAGVIKQIKITFVSFDMVNNCAAVMRAPTCQMLTATGMLAAVKVAKQHLLA
jgi:hypothetical protein